MKRNFTVALHFLYFQRAGETFHYIMYIMYIMQCIIIFRFVRVEGGLLFQTPTAQLPWNSVIEPFQYPSYMKRAMPQPVAIQRAQSIQKSSFLTVDVIRMKFDRDVWVDEARPGSLFNIVLIVGIFGVFYSDHKIQLICLRFCFTKFCLRFFFKIGRSGRKWMSWTRWRRNAECPRFSCP